jgi:hypothetical protein
MSAITRKVNVGLAAGAIVAAATLSPVSVAHAAEPGALGSTVGDAECILGSGESCLITTRAGGAWEPVFTTDEDSLIQNRLYWFGRANPDAPPRTTIVEFTPMSVLPGFLKGPWGWFFGKFDLEACVGGVTLTVGPYLKTTVSTGRGCTT